MTLPDLSDDDIAVLLEAAAPDVATDGVVAAVAERTAARRRRAARRRATSAVGIAAGIAILSVGLVAWVTGGNDTVDVAVPSSEPTIAGVATTTSLDATGGTAGEAVGRDAVPGDGDSVTPLAADDSGFWLVRGSSSGSHGSGPRTISRWSADGTRGPLTVVEGIPTMGFAADRLWVVVVEPAQEGPPEWRLKEIRPSDGFLLSSTAIPLTAEPLAVLPGATDPGGSFIAIHTASESVRVRSSDHVVTTEPPDSDVVAQLAPSLPDGFSIEGTDLVERKVTS